MVTGRCPYDAREPTAVILKHRDDPIPVPTSPHGPIPEAFERLIMRAMAKKPLGRQQAASELHAELSAVSDLLNRPGFRKWLPL
jgi:serine/threonine protein kinase